MARFPDSVGFVPEGRVARRASGVNWGFGQIVDANPRILPNTTYRIVFWVRNEDDIDGRIWADYMENESSVHSQHTGMLNRAWPRNTWVRDSLEIRTPASVNTNSSALAMNIACLDNENMSLSTTPAHAYIDDLVTYRIAPDGSYPPVIFSIEAYNRPGQPQDITVEVGNHALFRLEATGKAPMSYQWYRNDQIMEDETSRNLWVRDTKAEDNGALYKCEVSNADGSVTSDAATLNLTGVSATVSRPKLVTGMVSGSQGLADLQGRTLDRLPATGGVFIRKCIDGTTRITCELQSGRTSR